MPGDEPPAGFLRLEETSLGEDYWHYSLYLPSDAVRVAAEVAVPELSETETLALFQRPQPATDIEVLGHWLEYEIDPCDWLEHEIAELGYEIVSRKTVPMPGGIAGDVVARWTHDDEVYVGRFMAAKWGPRLYVVCGRVAERDYARCAADIFLTAASLRPMKSWPGLFAEGVTLVQQSDPFDWTVALPASWDVHEHDASPDGAWLDALHVSPAPPDEQLGDHDGRLGLAVMTRACARRPKDAAHVYLRALRDNDVLLDEVEFAEHEVDERFQQGWGLVCDVSRHGARGEVRCQVLMHEHAWVVAGVLGPPRDEDAGAWMRNKRALDVALDTMEMDVSL
jgi:hypothetical protein